MCSGRAFTFALLHYGSLPVYLLYFMFHVTAKPHKHTHINQIKASATELNHKKPATQMFVALAARTKIANKGSIEITKTNRTIFAISLFAIDIVGAIAAARQRANKPNTSRQQSNSFCGQNENTGCNGMCSSAHVNGPNVVGIEHVRAENGGFQQHWCTIWISGHRRPNCSIVFILHFHLAFGKFHRLMWSCLFRRLICQFYLCVEFVVFNIKENTSVEWGPATATCIQHGPINSLPFPCRGSASKLYLFNRPFLLDIQNYGCTASQPVTSSTSATSYVALSGAQRTKLNLHWSTNPIYEASPHA